LNLKGKAMKLQRINSTAATIVEHEDGRCVLYSYSTPVAIMFRPDLKIVRTAKQFSVTTSKHVNAFVKEHDRCKVEFAAQDWIEKMA